MENETVNQVQEQSTADQQDNFLAGFDDESPAEVIPADQQEEQGEGAESAEAEAATEEAAEEKDGAADQQAAESAGADAAGAEEKKAAPNSWNIKHMDEDKTLTAEDITPELLQKGMDYDRIRSKYDEAKPIVEVMKQFADSAKMSVPDYLRYIRAEAKRASGMSEDDAKRAVELEDREAAVSAKEAQQKEAADAKTAAEANAQADIAAFASAFPEDFNRYKSDPSVIPPEVWAEVNGGKSLTAAYAAHLVHKAQALANTAVKTAQAKDLNERNNSRAAGSMKSAGNDSKAKDAFIAGFDG